MELVKREWPFFSSDIFSPEERRSGWGSCHMLDEENETVLLVDLPGAQREDVSLRHQNGHIQIRASRKAEWNGGAERLVQRSIALPDINPETIKAQLQDGVLEIRAKREATSEEIEIS